MLDRHPASQAFVDRLINRPHAAPAEKRFQPVRSKISLGQVVQGSHVFLGRRRSRIGPLV